MCGIAGWCYGSKNSWQLQNMLDAIRHRGPESFGTYESDSVSLGHARLAIIDEPEASSLYQTKMK